MTEKSLACPCCGASLDQVREVRWNGGAGVLTWPGGAATLTLCQARIFDVLWPSLETGTKFNGQQILDRAYAWDPHGGPENLNCAAVHISHIRRRIADAPLVISGGTWSGGYSLRVKQ